MESNILISVGTWLFEKLAEKGFDNIFSKITTQEHINKVFKEAVVAVSKRLQEKYPSALGNSIESFFSNPSTCEELIKTMFVKYKIDTSVFQSSIDFSSLPENFFQEYINELKSELLKDPEFNKILNNKEILITLLGISTEIGELNRHTILTRHEIADIKKILKEYFQKTFSWRVFLSLYSKNVLHNLSQINFFGLGVDLSIKKNRKYLNDIFIEPIFRINRIDTQEQLKIKLTKQSIESESIARIEFKDLFSLNKNLVILGNPGAGKSILVRALICFILEHQTYRFNSNRLEESTPFRIELRKYLSFKRSNKGNILHYLAHLLISEFAIPSIEYQQLEYFFKNNFIIIFYDGLDEIFNVNDKIQIKNDIENLQTTYKNIMSIVTSRKIGYDEARFEDNEFIELEILPFNEYQIETYIRKWYSKEEPDEEIRNSEINDLLKKSNSIDEELLNNPLLLSLIVILYRNNLKLPESKLEIYQSCTKTLVDKWDSHKELEIQLEPEIYKRREIVFADLAFWQYQQLSTKNTIIKYSDVINIVNTTLVSKLGIADEYTGPKLAEDFLNYAQKRSLYFENNFTHKTFLEYFTAYWIYANLEKKHKSDELFNVIYERIDNSFWFIVLELLFNLIDKDQADNEIIDGIINKLITKKDSSFPFLIRIIPNLSHISNKQIKKTINSSIITSIRIINLRKELKKSLFDNSKKALLASQIYDEVVSLLMNEKFKNFLPENLHYIHSECKEINKQKEFFVFFTELFFILFHQRVSDLNSFKAIIDQEEDSFLSIIVTDRIVWRFYYDTINKKQDHMTLMVDFISKFGVDALFEPYTSHFGRFIVSEYFVDYYLNQLNPNNIFKMQENLGILEKYGLTKTSILKKIVKMDFFPWYDSERLSSMIRYYKSLTDNFIIAMILISIYDTFYNKPPFELVNEPKQNFIENFKNDNLLEKILLFINRDDFIKEIFTLLNISDILVE